MSKFIGLTINEIHQLYKSSKLTPQKYLEKIIEYIKLTSEENYFITTTFKEALDSVKQLPEFDLEKYPLWGIPYSIKDNIITKNIRTTGSCKILDNFIPQYSSTLFENIQKSFPILLGKNNLDELGMEGTGLFSKYGIVKNPYDKERIIGGSSSGSAGIVASGILPFAIGTDTGDSVRAPAILSGIIGFKPSWNRISRYGVIPYTPSLDTTGVLARSVDDCTKVYNLLKSYDPKDATSYNEEFNIPIKPTKNIKGKKICFFKEHINELKKTDAESYKIFNKQIEVLKKHGAIVKEYSFDIDLLKACSAIYNIISYSESTSCQAYLQGITHGETIKDPEWNNHITKVRTDGFTFKTKARQIIGSWYLHKNNIDKYFNYSKKIRRIIFNKLEDLFKDFDGFICPTKSIPPLIKDKLKTKRVRSEAYDILSDHLLLANFAGLPSISIPVEKRGNFLESICINTKPYSEVDCLSIALAIESESGLKNSYCEKVVNEK